MMQAAAGGFVDPRASKTNLLINDLFGDADIAAVTGQLGPDGVTFDGVKYTSGSANASQSLSQGTITTGITYTIGGYFKAVTPVGARLSLGNSTALGVLPSTGIYGVYADGLLAGEPEEWTLVEVEQVSTASTPIYLWLGLFNTFSTGEEFFASRLMMYVGNKVT